MMISRQAMIHARRIAIADCLNRAHGGHSTPPLSVVNIARVYRYIRGDTAAGHYTEYYR
jgi:transketolase